MIIDKLLMNNDWFITLDGKVVAEVGEGTEEFAEDIARSVQANIDHLVYDNEVVDIKNDDDKLGIIIDVFEDSTLEEFLESVTIWFDDYRIEYEDEF